MENIQEFKNNIMTVINRLADDLYHYQDVGDEEMEKECRDNIGRLGKAIVIADGIWQKVFNTENS